MREKYENTVEWKTIKDLRDMLILKILKKYLLKYTNEHDNSDCYFENDVINIRYFR